MVSARHLASVLGGLIVLVGMAEIGATSPLQAAATKDRIPPSAAERVRQRDVRSPPFDRMAAMGAIRPFEVLRRNFGNPPYRVILCNPASNRSRPIPGAQNRLQKNAT
jgi:hypothetical protein